MYIPTSRNEVYAGNCPHASRVPRGDAAGPDLSQCETTRVLVSAEPNKTATIVRWPSPNIFQRESSCLGRPNFGILLE